MEEMPSSCWSGSMMECMVVNNYCVFLSGGEGGVCMEADRGGYYLPMTTITTYPLKIENFPGSE